VETGIVHYYESLIAESEPSQLIESIAKVEPSAVRILIVYERISAPLSDGASQTIITFVELTLVVGASG
jgi:hypothetical protein